MNSVAQKDIERVQMRPYQLEAITAILDAQASARALCVLPTGTGKTEVFSFIIHTLRVPTLVLAHRKELLEQARKKLLRYFTEDEIGLVGNGCEQWERPIIVGSVQTLRNRLPQLRAKGIKLVVCDESHHATDKNSYKKIFDAVPGAFIVGFTATPERLDGKRITDIFGTPVYERNIREMVKARWLADLRGIVVRSSSSLDNIQKRMGDYSERELSNVLDQQERNEFVVSAYLKYASNKRAICFAINVEHAHNLADLFREYGVSAIALDGKTPIEEREYYIEQFSKGKIQVLVNCELFTEGFDAPFVECIIMARPTLSRSLFLQMIGRGTRLYEGKQECLILDITDNCTMHRLQPQSINTAIGINARSNTSLLEYEKQEQERKEKQERARFAELERLREIEEGKRRVDEERKRRAIQERRDIVFTEIDLFGNKVAWAHMPDETITARVAYTTITIAPVDAYGAYSVKATDKFKTEWLARAVALPIAKDIAEKKAQAIRAAIEAKSRNEPTPKQLEAMRRLRIPVSAGCTFQQAHALISARVAEFDRSRSA